MSYDEHLISQAGGDGDPLDAIQRRADMATAGPWKAEAYWIHDSLDSRVRVTSPSDRDEYNTAEMVKRADAEFIAHARTDVPTLLALVRTQQATIAAVLNLANTSGRCGWRISADDLRKVLRGES